MPASLKFTLPMPPVMSHEEWMDRTHVSRKIRGPRLRDLDDAILFFEKAKNETALIKVAEALLAWMDQSHPNGDYLKSKRNDNQAIGAMLPVINWFFSDPSRREMLAALEHLKSLYRQQEMTFYTGKQLEFKTQFHSVEGTLLASACEKILHFLESIGRTIGLSQVEVRKLSDDTEFKRRFELYFTGLLRLYDFSSAVQKSSCSEGKLCFIRDIIPGVKLAMSGLSLIDAIQAKRKADAGRVLFQSESPEALFNGLSEFFQREIELRTIRTMSAGVDVLKVFVPGLHIATIIQYATRLAFAVAYFIQDYREMNSANEMLRQNTIDSTIFAKAPVLSAYHICALDTAGTALFLFNGKDRWLSYDFVEKVEKYNKGILTPVKAKARELINASDLVLTPGGIPLVSLASDPAQLAAQHGWFWWKYQNAKRWWKGPSSYAKKAIAGPHPEAAGKKSA